ncbi:MAG TPA: DUF4097 family beta strand repeat-containing protein [Gemmatimonadota bacterium]|nr:DUF4097 family beta strand repeat-containing protein [Gemmatimonadota bacterium]
MRHLRIPAAACASAGLVFALALTGCEAAQGAIHGARDAARSATSAAASSAASAVASAARDAFESSGPARTSSFDWNGEIAAGKTLEVRGINGAITAKPADGRTASVHATLTGHHSDPTDVHVQVVKEDGNVTLCAVYPGSDADDACRSGGGHQKIHDNDVKVEFEVEVPSGVTFVPATVNGEIDAHGMSGPVRARTVNGSISLETSGWAEASTVNGSLDVRMGSTAAPNGLDFKTVNGAIDLYLPADASLDVDAETVNGGIDTDFPLTVEGRFLHNHASGTIGGGGTSLELRTVNGSVELHRQG